VRISFWLIPASPVKEDLANLIAGMAARFDGPAFTPHVTLCSGEVSDAASAQRVLSETAARFKPMLLAIKGVGFTDEFTRTLFLQFAASDESKQLSESLRQAAAISPGRFDPHLSLVYATLSDEVKRRLALTIPTPPFIEFDAVQVVATGARTSSRADVEAWQLLGEARLK
jgi:hypothetical protein